MALGDLNTCLEMVKRLVGLTECRSEGLHNLGVTEKLITLYTLHTAGATRALEYVHDSRERMRSRSVVYFIDASAAMGLVLRKSAAGMNLPTKEAIAIRKGRETGHAHCPGILSVYRLLKKKLRPPSRR